MPDLWIDDHVGDEARPRPEFKTALRSSLAADLGRRRTPWRAIGWAAAALALIGVVATVVVSTRDDTHTISPGPSGQALIDQVQGRKWYLATNNGFPAASLPEFPASFELHPDGTYVGSDGCNDYGSTVDSQPKSGWTIDGTRLRITGITDMTAVGCFFRTSMPLADDTALVLSPDGTTLTLTDPSGRIYVATTLPPLTDQALADRLVGVRWTVTSVQEELSPQVAWFEFSADGTISGFNGCVEYSGAQWSLVGNEVTAAPVLMDQPLCTDKPDIIPFTGNTSRIAIDGLGLGLTITNESVYTAVPPDPSVPTTTTAPFVNGNDLAKAIADRDWYVITADGVMVQNSISIRFHADGTVTGNNGCMDYANDPAAADGWSLNGRLISVPALIEPGDCVGVDTMVPVLNGAALSLDATGTRLTVNGAHTYFLSSDPARDRVANVRWYVFVHNNEQVTVNAWFELHDDGSFSGFDGCNDYASATDPSSPASGWKIENGVLRVFGEIGASTVGCAFDPLMPVVDGTSLSFQEAFNAIYMEHDGDQFTVTLSPTVDPAATTTTTVPASPLLTPEDRASLLAAALLDRAKVHNSFGPGGLPAQDLVVIDSVGALSTQGILDPAAVPLTDAERAAIEATFAPNTVTFVAFADVVYPLNGGTQSVLQVGPPVVIDGQLTVASQLVCGGTCGAGGAIAAIKNADGTWTMGDPVGPQFVA